MTTALETWSRGSHSDGGITHDTYRKGAGPGVIVIHEIPGLTRAVIAFGDEVVAAGYTVVMPRLFGHPGIADNAVNQLREVARTCVSREFVTLRTGRTAPIANWLRSLARSLHAELGGKGVGALGMCFTGGFALAMMVDNSVVAPVVAQPALPIAIGASRSRDLGLSPADLAVVRRRAANGCPVLGLEFPNDPMTGTRFDTLTSELGENFIKVELAGRGHSTVTRHRRQVAVDAVLEFFERQLR